MNIWYINIIIIIIKNYIVNKMLILFFSRGKKHSHYYSIKRIKWKNKMLNLFKVRIFHLIFFYKSQNMIWQDQLLLANLSEGLYATSQMTII